MSAPFDFCRVIAPVEPEEFFRDYWEKRPLLLFRSDPGYYADLFSLADVDYLISSTDLRHPAVRLVKNGSEIPLQEYTTDIPWGSHTFERVADADRLLTEYQQGSTIILQALHRSWRPLSQLCRSLERQFGYPVQTNVYLTPRASQGFAPHYDTHDVLVLQIAGSKHWRLYDSPLLLPHRSQPYQASRVRIGAPLNEFDLNAGDLVYLPRGYIHEALTSDTDSLHITMGILATTWVDVFAEALSTCQRDPRFRKSLPVGFVGRSEEFGELLTVFSEAVSLEEVLTRISERFVSSRLPLLEGHLTELDQVDRLDLETVVRRRRDLIYRIIPDPKGESVSLLFHGKKVKFPGYVEPALRFLVEAGDFKACAIPGDLDDPGKLVLVRRLVKEGFLTIHKEDSENRR